MDNDIFISIIIPVFNGEKYIEKCLNGIGCQTFTNFELVFIDDNSADSSKNIIQNFLKNNSSIKYEYVQLDENHGIAYAKNLGIQKSKGSYILFHDQDDWMEASCLEVLVKAAENGNLDRVSASYREVDPTGKTLRTITYGADFSKWFGTALHAVLFKRDIFVSNGIQIPNNTLMEDAYVNSHFAACANKFAYVDQVLFNYLIRPDSTSGVKNNNTKWNAITLFKSCLNCYYPMYTELVNASDKTSIEYMVIKQYYFYLLHNNRYSSYAKVLSEYNELKKMITDLFPGYQKNKCLTLLKPNGDRARGRKYTFLLSRIEKYNLMKLFLKLYLIISKHKYLP